MATPSERTSTCAPATSSPATSALYLRDGDTYRQAPTTAILHQARRIIARSFRPNAPVLDAPHTLRAFLHTHLATRPHEIFALITLDSRLRLIHYTEIFRGTVDAANIHPREVIKEALARNAAAVVLVHNHPSGVSDPSLADEIITRRLKDALDLVDIRVIDHLIVGQDIYSFAEHGLL